MLLDIVASVLHPKALWEKVLKGQTISVAHRKYKPIMLMLPQDVLHDTLDGICKLEILFVLKSLIANNEINLTADSINHILTSRPYRRMDQRNKPELLNSPLKVVGH